eukprot:6476671-Amphidinium_carterae.1
MRKPWGEIADMSATWRMVHIDLESWNGTHRDQPIHVAENLQALLTCPPVFVETSIAHARQEDDYTNDQAKNSACDLCCCSNDRSSAIIIPLSCRTWFLRPISRWVLFLESMREIIDCPLMMMFNFKNCIAGHRALVLGKLPSLGSYVEPLYSVRSASRCSIKRRATVCSASECLN